MKIFGMGGFELVIILVVILLIFGPKNLPKLGSAIGKTVSNLRSGMNDGKKKDGQADSGASADGQDAPEVQVAEIEGEVETVETEPATATAAAAEAAPEPETAAEAVPAAATEGEAPRKVKRVVKKKVTAANPAETE